MIKAIIFGGTTEGRKLYEFCAINNIPIIYCVATDNGVRILEGTTEIQTPKRHPQAMQYLNTRIGRLNVDEMLQLFKETSPALVIDAAHPYATKLRGNITEACEGLGLWRIRIKRQENLYDSRDIIQDIPNEEIEKPFCHKPIETNYLIFPNMDDLIFWLEKEPGNIFVTTGSSGASYFARLTDFQNRVWLRILPNLSSLKTSLDLGYRPQNIICMQGPFSQELNRAMFQRANARILITKDSGTLGGFAEKVRAAQSLSMITAVLSRPEESKQTTLEDVCKILMELSI